MERNPEWNFVAGLHSFIIAEAFPCGAAYQWQKNGHPLPGATNYYLEFITTAESDAGGYTAVASNAFGSSTSSVQRVSVTVPKPAFDLTNSIRAFVGMPFSYCLPSPGVPHLTVRWIRNEKPVQPEASDCLTFENLTAAHAGVYRAIADEHPGKTLMTLALTAAEEAPKIVAEAENISVTEDETFQLPFQATGGPPPEIYLNLNGAPAAFAGAMIVGATTNDAGLYQFIASNRLGTATSRVARVTVERAGPLDRWTERNPLPQVNTIRSIATGGGRWVAVGDRGTLLASTNGLAWHLVNPKTEQTLHGVHYAAGGFVAVGDAGVLLVSSDGESWAQRRTGFASKLSGVAFGHDELVAIGDYGMVSSSDGLKWAPAGSYRQPGNAIAFGAGKFVAASAGLHVSTNGVDWVRALNQGWLENVAFLNGLFVAGGDDGNIQTSADGVAWQARASNTGRRLYEAAYGNGRYVAVGARGVIVSSADASSWRAEQSGTPDRLEAVIFSDGMFVAAGENGTMLTSPDGVAWSKRNLGTTRDLDGMTATPDRVVAVGKGGTILTSTNGVDFVQQASGTTNSLHGVSWNGELFVAVGEPGVILTSPDSVRWTAQNSTVTNSLKRVVFANSLWVAVGTEGTIVVSTDGVRWNSIVRRILEDLNDIAYGNGMFLAVGDDYYNPNGTLMRSTDGFNWTNSIVSVGKNVRSLTFAAGKFVAVANDGFVLESPDGRNWQIIPYINYTNFRDIAWHDGLWTIAGNNGAILTSTNAMNWKRRISRARENLHETVLFRGRFLAIGNRGTIIQSARVSQPRINAARQNGSVLLRILSVEPGRDELESSQDLQSWTRALELSEPETLHTEPAPPQNTQKFFRVIDRNPE